MKNIKRTAVAGLSALAIGGVALATSLSSNASPLGGLGGTLECSYQTNASTMALSGSCGSNSALGTNGGKLAGQINKASRSAAGEAALSTTLGSLSGTFEGSLTSGGKIVGEFTPAGSVGIPFVAIPG